MSVRIQLGRILDTSMKGQCRNVQILILNKASFLNKTYAKIFDSIRYFIIFMANQNWCIWPVSIPVTFKSTVYSMFNKIGIISGNIVAGNFLNCFSLIISTASDLHGSGFF